ncbi:MAG: hypothetical protein KKF98_05610 [Bacteroidetes bacterium]|nr:hypothetical protein [Bacteroidota bacterium]
MNKKKKAIKYGLWTVVVLLLIQILKDKYIGPGGMRGMDLEKPLAWVDIYDNLFFYFVLAIFFGYIIYLYEAKAKSTTVVCDNCGKVGNKGKNLTCECGGNYSDIDLMKWVDE